LLHQFLIWHFLIPFVRRQFDWFDQCTNWLGQIHWEQTFANLLHVEQIVRQVQTQAFGHISVEQKQGRRWQSQVGIEQLRTERL
jgi:hypothetical protein